MVCVRDVSETGLNVEGLWPSELRVTWVSAFQVSVLTEYSYAGMESAEFFRWDSALGGRGRLVNWRRNGV